MDPIRNPYSPGAGAQPPELAGRRKLLDTAHIALERSKLGRSAKSLLMVGLRGVGKTVLLDRIRQHAEADGIYTLWIEHVENRSLPSKLVSQLRLALIKLSMQARAKDLLGQAFSALAGFANSLKIKFQDIEVGLDFPLEPGLANCGDLESDLSDLLEIVGRAAQAEDACIALFLDEMQYAAENELAALISALHRSSQRQLPVIMFGAGLPQLRGRMGDAKSYAERLFSFPVIDQLTTRDAKLAISRPAEAEGVEIREDALELIVEQTRCYPYFLQEWGKHIWDAAESSPITRTHVETASVLAIADLDESFFRVRFDRLTPLERMYLRAMAELGEGPHRSGKIAALLQRRVQTLGPIRAQLISKGMLWSPSHGDTAFTAPLFDQFMLRNMSANSLQ